jgi:hypothetical protein
LQWKLDLKQTEIPRAFELAAVKEFHVYVTEQDKDLDFAHLPPPIAILPLPSRKALLRYDLDSVRWVLFDAVADRGVHNFRYHVLAVPKDRAIFTQNQWFDIPVSVPSSNFDSKPETLVPLPLSADPNRGFAFIFNEPPGLDDSDREKLRVALRITQSVGDPLLALDAAAASLQSDHTELDEGNKLNALLLKACSDPANSLASALDHLFPAMRSAVHIETAIPQPPFEGVDGWTAPNGPPIIVSSNSKVFFSHAMPGMDAMAPKKRQMAESVATKNPFLKFHIAYFSPKNYPRLRHTTGSEFILSDWLQAFPNDLVFDESNSGTVTLRNAWGGAKAPNGVPQDAVILCRFHVFISNPKEKHLPAFHLSSFYSGDPYFTLSTLRGKVGTALQRFGLSVLSSKDQSDTDLTVVGEEGLWAVTSSPQPAAITGAAPAVTEAAFLVLRSTKEPFVVETSKVLK